MGQSLCQVYLAVYKNLKLVINKVIQRYNLQLIWLSLDQRAVILILKANFCLALESICEII